MMSTAHITTASDLILFQTEISKSPSPLIWISIIALTTIAGLLIAFSAWSQGGHLAAVAHLPTVSIHYTMTLPFGLSLVCFAIATYLLSRLSPTPLPPQRLPQGGTIVPPIAHTTLSSASSASLSVPTPILASPSISSTTQLSPIPGRVTNFLVALHDRVEKNQMICTIECMKMEAEIRAECAGTITAIHCQINQEIQQGAPLCRIQPGN